MLYSAPPTMSEANHQPKLVDNLPAHPAQIQHVDVDRDLSQWLAQDALLENTLDLLLTEVSVSKPYDQPYKQVFEAFATPQLMSFVRHPGLMAAVSDAWLQQRRLDELARKGIMYFPQLDSASPLSPVLRWAAEHRWAGDAATMDLSSPDSTTPTNDVRMLEPESLLSSVDGIYAVRVFKAHRDEAPEEDIAIATEKDAGPVYESWMSQATYPGPGRIRPYAQPLA
ncbi:hypothetical protein DL93DRAFT_1964169 [Clavulina sp. PMI_390]|nr:hypothetical protein DL93DRAFT_1964169 [Clavulina sp. PMI_390]